MSQGYEFSGQVRGRFPGDAVTLRSPDSDENWHWDGPFGRIGKPIVHGAGGRQGHERISPTARTDNGTRALRTRHGLAWICPPPTVRSRSEQRWCHASITEREGYPGPSNRTIPLPCRRRSLCRRARLPRMAQGHPLSPSSPRTRPVFALFYLQSWRRTETTETHPCIGWGFSVIARNPPDTATEQTTGTANRCNSK